MYFNSFVIKSDRWFFSKIILNFWYNLKSLTYNDSNNLLRFLHLFRLFYCLYFRYNCLASSNITILLYVYVSFFFQYEYLNKQSNILRNFKLSSCLFQCFAFNCFSITIVRTRFECSNKHFDPFKISHRNLSICPENDAIHDYGCPSWSKFCV